MTDWKSGKCESRIDCQYIHSVVNKQRAHIAKLEAALLDIRKGQTPGDYEVTKITVQRMVARANEALGESA